MTGIQYSKDVIFVKGQFNGLYEWGVNWLYDARLKWNEYWKGARSDMWDYLPTEDCEYLVGVEGSIYLHPMGFKAILSGCGVTDAYGSPFSTELKELNRLCTECANACGGTFTLYVSNEQNVNFGQISEWQEK